MSIENEDEFGKLFVTNSDQVGKDSFLLGGVKKKVKPGDQISNNEIEILYASLSADLADKYIALGIARRETKNGRDVLLMIHPDQDVKF